MPTRILSRILAALRGAPAPARARSVADFRDSLRRECARADRTGREFSLLMLAPSPSGASATLALLERRLRETDEVGWMEGGAVGALLTDTPREGAQLVVEVSDNGQGAGRRAAPRAAGRGIGLSNTQARLEKLYHGQAQLEFMQPAAGGTVLRLRLPLGQPAPARPAAASSVVAAV